VVVAGDTLNDLSLFETGLKGIVVGQAEAALSRKVAAIGGAAYLAEAAGGGGIMEGLIHHGFLGTAADESVRAGPASRERGAVRTDPASQDRQLVMVYHRLPFETVLRDGRLVRRSPKSPNGIIPTLLGFFRRAGIHRSSRSGSRSTGSGTRSCRRCRSRSRRTTRTSSTCGRCGRT
jgi:hypothetical protein